jgi:hypothetical protein
MFRGKGSKARVTLETQSLLVHYVSIDAFFTLNRCACVSNTCLRSCGILEFEVLLRSETRLPGRDSCCGGAFDLASENCYIILFRMVSLVL